MPDETNEIVESIWAIARQLSEHLAKHEYARLLIPLTVIRRLDAVLQGTWPQVRARAHELDAADTDLTDRDQALKAITGLGFYNTSEVDLAGLLDGDPDTLVTRARAYTATYSPEIRQIVEGFDLEALVSRLDASGVLGLALSGFNNLNLAPGHISSEEMGRVFDTLLVGLSETGADILDMHYTPAEVTNLMVNLLVDPVESAETRNGQTRTILDPVAGSGHMLTAAESRIRSFNARSIVEVYGQEIDPESWAIAASAQVIRGVSPQQIQLGNSLTADAFADQHYDYLIGNPPFNVDWRAERETIEAEHALGDRGRFAPTLPRPTDASLLFVLHMISKMKPNDPSTAEGSRVAVLLGPHPMRSGGAGSRESEIRRWILENDLLEGIVALPDQLNYYTQIPTYVWILTNRKQSNHAGLVRLIDARDLDTIRGRNLGDKHKELTSLAVETITQMYTDDEIDDEREMLLPVEEFGYARLHVEIPGEHRNYEIPLPTGYLQMDEAQRQQAITAHSREYLNSEVLPFSPDAVMAQEWTRIGYDLNVADRFNELRASKQIAKLKTQYKSYQTLPICQVAQIHRVSPGHAFKIDHNCVYLHVYNATASTSVEEGHHHLYLQLALNSQADKDFMAQYLNSEIAQLGLASCSDESGVRRKISRRKLSRLGVAVPSLVEQEEIVATLARIDSFKVMVEQLRDRLILNPSEVIGLDRVLDQALLLSRADQIHSIIRRGESKTKEFKQTFAQAVGTTRKEKFITRAIVKTIASFLNSEGGDLLVGVRDDGKCTGIGQEVKDIFDNSADRYLLFVKSALRHGLGSRALDSVQWELVDVDDQQVLFVRAEPANEPCFIDNNKEFYVRVNPATEQLHGKALIDYVHSRFS